MDAARHFSSSPGSDHPGRPEQEPPTPSISLVLPAYNEQEVIAQAIDEAEEALSRITSDYEVLVVDDGSQDNTLAIAQQEASQRPSVRVLTYGQNQGYGAALRTGFLAASKDYVGFTDADCQFHLPQLNRLVLLLSSCDIACGYRIDRRDGLLRSVYSKTYNALVRLLLGTGVRDCDCALKLFRRDVLETISIDSNGFLINAELLAKANMQGKRVVEVGVNHRQRPRGESTVSFRHVLPVLVSLVRFWWSQVQFPADAPTKSAPSQVWSLSKSTQATCILGVLCAVVFFLNLSYPLIEPDENRYAQIALEMVQSGDYLVPRLNGEPYLDKPPLLYWATAASFQIFGTHEQSARLVSAIAAAWTVLCTFLLGRRLLGDRVAFFGALILFLCTGFVLAGRYIIMDGLLTCFTTTSLLAGFVAIRGERLRWGWWVAAAFACGLGVLTKGPIALVLTLPPLLGMQLLSPRVAPAALRHWLAFGGIALGMTLPWFTAVALAQPDFASYFLWKHHVIRFVTAFDHQAPVWYYIPVLLVGMFPCSLLTVPVAAFLVGRSDALRQARSQELGFVVLAAVWIVAFFSASSCKLPTYVLPSVPLLCLTTATLVSALLSNARSQMPFARLAYRLPDWATAAALLAGSGLAIADLVLQPHQGIEQAVNWAVLLCTGFYFTYRLAVHHAQRVKTAPWLVAAATSIVIMMFAFQKFVPQFADQRSVHANAARIQVNSEGQVLPVAYLDWQIDAQNLYFTQRNIDRFTEQDLDELTQYVLDHSEVVFVANPDGAAQLRQRLGTTATFTKLPGARGRLYMVSTSSSPHTIVGARRVTTTQR